MTKALKDVLQRAETWPEEAQEQLARMAHEIEDELKGDYHAAPDELLAIDQSEDSGIADDREVEAAFRAFRRA